MSWVSWKFYWYFVRTNAIIFWVIFSNKLKIKSIGLSKKERIKLYRELFELKNYCSIITGGAGGLGSSFALALAEFGSDIVIIDKNIDNSDNQKESIEKLFEALDNNDSVQNIYSNLK